MNVPYFLSLFIYKHFSFAFCKFSWSALAVPGPCPHGSLAQGLAECSLMSKSGFSAVAVIHQGGVPIHQRRMSTRRGRFNHRMFKCCFPKGEARSSHYTPTSWPEPPYERMYRPVLQPGCTAETQLNFV